MDNALEVVKEFYDAADRHDADGLGTLLAEDMSFVGPLMVTESRETYVEMNRQLLPHHVATRMLAQFQANGQVCSIYEMDLKAPDGGIFTAEMADWITVDDGLIRSQRIYYDPRRFADAFGPGGEPAAS